MLDCKTLSRIWVAQECHRLYTYLSQFPRLVLSTSRGSTLEFAPLTSYHCSFFLLTYSGSCLPSAAGRMTRCASLQERAHTAPPHTTRTGRGASKGSGVFYPFDRRDRQQRGADGVTWTIFRRNRVRPVKKRLPPPFSSPRFAISTKNGLTQHSLPRVEDILGTSKDSGPFSAFSLVRLRRSRARETQPGRLVLGPFYPCCWFSIA